MHRPRLDRATLLEALRAWRDAGSIGAAARALGLSRSTLHRRLRAATREGVELEDGTRSPVAYRLGGRVVRSGAPSVSGGQADSDPLGLEALLESEGGAPVFDEGGPVRPPPAPKGWEPGVAWKGREGSLTVALERPPADLTEWDELLEVWGLDPARYCVVGEPEFRAWDTAAKDAAGRLVTRRLYYYRARIGLRSRYVSPADVEELLERLDALELPAHRPGGDVALVVCLADWQIGKGDGDGLEGTVRRALRGIHGIRTFVEELRAVGRAPGRIHVQGMGDLVEQCDGHYSGQRFSVELHRRDQVKVARRLVLRALEEAATLAERVTVGAVPGNHGENREGGKAITGTGDNDDVALFEQVAEVVARASGLEHVAFALPGDELEQVLEIGGARVGFHHGHVGKAGATPQAKARRWWADMIFSRTALEHVDVLVTAHYHHFSIVDHGPRLHVQCPTIDGGSDWWANMGGGHSRAGTLAFTVSGGVPGDWRIL